MSVRQTYPSTIKRELLVIMRFVRRELKRELVAQGHKLTGNLIDSINVFVEAQGNTFNAFLTMDDYYIFLEKGVSASRIPYQRGSGVRRSRYIEGLIRFWKLKGKGEQAAKRAAFATANSHKQEGMPTRGSYTFSKNGRRKGFLSFIVDQNQDKLNKLVDTKIGAAIERTFDTMINNAAVRAQVIK